MLFGNNLRGNRFDEVLSSKRSKREKGIGGGLQVYTQYVCEKLEKEKQMLNTDVWSGFPA